VRKNSKSRIRSRREGALARLLLVTNTTKRALAEIETLRARLGVR
jgi:hypothetical protein